MRKDQKKIIYLHRTQGRAAEGSHIRGMVDGFREHNFKVSIIGPPGCDLYNFADQRINKKQGWVFKQISIILRRFASDAPQIVFEFAELGYNLLILLLLKKRLNFDSSYSFLYERYALNSFAGALFAKKNKLTYVLEVNDATIIERSRPLVFRKMASKIESWVLKRADFIVTITQHFKVLLVKKYNISEKKIVVLPNAINPEKYKLLNKNKLKRKMYGIPESSTVIGCVGAFVRWHGLELLVHTLASECLRHNFYLFFIGDGPVRKDVEELSRKLLISDRVSFTGFVDPEMVPYLIELIDICVIPQSNSHCSPMKLFEYMAAAKPIVLPGYQPLLDTIRDGNEGIVFKPNDSKDLKRKILELHHSKDMQTLLGKKAKILVNKKYTWNKNSSKVLDLLKKENAVS